MKGGTPPALSKLSAGADRVLGAAGSGRWASASVSAGRAAAAWRAHRRDDVPHRLVEPTDRALEALRRAVRSKDTRGARNAALDTTQATLDLQLRYRPAAEIDRARLDLWATQVGVDAEARDLKALSGDTATIEWIRDRVAHTYPSAAITRIDTLLEQLRTNVTDKEPAAAATTAAELQQAVKR